MADDGRRLGDVLTRWVCFELAGQSYGIPILEVQEVLACPEIEPVPGAPEGTLGVINLRGAIVTVLDLRTRLRLPPMTPDAQTRIIVLLQGGEPVGLRVDRVINVRALPQGAIKPAPDTGQSGPGLKLRGLYSRKGEMLTLLDAAALLDKKAA